MATFQTRLVEIKGLCEREKCTAPTVSKACVVAVTLVGAMACRRVVGMGSSGQEVGWVPVRS